MSCVCLSRVCDGTLQLVILTLSHTIFKVLTVKVEILNNSQNWGHIIMAFLNVDALL